MTLTLTLSTIGWLPSELIAGTPMYASARANTGAVNQDEPMRAAHLDLHRPLNCGRMRPHATLRCAKAQLHKAHVQLRHPSTRHSPGYWHWRIRVTHRWIRQAKYELAWLHPHGPAKMYAYVLTMRRWHSEAEWHALDSIISQESRWNPCAHYPGMSECGYMGSNACGIPQAYYCPTSWRGRLWESRYEQCRWLINYVASRYGDPYGAVYARNTRGWY